MELYTDTPMSKAVFELLSQLNTEIEKQLSDIRESGVIKAYIFGGCAVHIYTNARGSNDLDVEIEATKKLDVKSLVLDLDEVYFTDPVRGESLLVMDDTFQIGITPVLSPDFKERAIPLSVCKDKVLHVYLVSAVDIAVSKLSRYGTGDEEDIVELYKNKRFTLDEFKVAAYEALDYTATPDSLRPNIEHAIITLEAV